MYKLVISQLTVTKWGNPASIYHGPNHWNNFQINGYWIFKIPPYFHIFMFDVYVWGFLGITRISLETT